MLSIAPMLASLIKLSSVLKPHLVETLLTVIIQRRFNNISALKLAVICLSRTQLKVCISYLINCVYCWFIHLASHCQSPFAKYHSTLAFPQTLHQQLSRSITHPGCYHWTPTLLVPFTSDEHLSNHACWTSCSCLSRHAVGIRPPHFVYFTAFWNPTKVIGHISSQPLVVHIQFIFSKCVGGTSISRPDIGAPDLFEPPTMAVCRGSICFVYMHRRCTFVWPCICYAPFRPDACRAASVIVVCVAGALQD